MIIKIEGGWKIHTNIFSYNGGKIGGTHTAFMTAQFPRNFRFRLSATQRLANNGGVCSMSRPIPLVENL